MRIAAAGIVCVLLWGCRGESLAQRGGQVAGAEAGGAGASIRALLARQAADWNRGDLDAFATGYKNSPEILFIGSHVAHGYAGMLSGYKARYSTREAMGQLSFTELEVQPLDERFATATGHFALQRSAKGGGDTGGYFLLVLEKTDSGWKIVRDDTTVPCASGK